MVKISKNNYNIYFLKDIDLDPNKKYYKITLINYLLNNRKYNLVINKYYGKCYYYYDKIILSKFLNEVKIENTKIIKYEKPIYSKQLII